MNRDEALELLRGGHLGIARWNEWREMGAEIPDLRGVNLSEAKLIDVNLSGANFTNANL